MLHRIAALSQRSPLLLAGGTLVAVLLIGVLDYLTGYEFSMSIFYLVPISVATWFVDWRLGLCVAGFSVVCAIVSDVASGTSHDLRFVFVWNALIALLFYLVMVATLSRLRIFQDQLEAKVRERTAALTDEMDKRERLEKELLAVSEREQRRIGQDLHDGLCQHLTGTALAGSVLGDKLAAKALPESADAHQIAALVEEGITLARNLARGLVPVEVEAEGLAVALRALAKTTTERFGVTCRFEERDPVPIDEPATAIHLFRIAQEALSNAIRHGRAREVIIRLTALPAGLQLSIHDNGSGLPDSPQERRGMGLRIMQHRATMIGATFEIRREAPGTLVICQLPEISAKEDL